MTEAEDRAKARKLVAILWFVAAGLALTAAVIRFARGGEVTWGVIAAGAFAAAMALAAWSRRKDAAGK